MIDGKTFRVGLDKFFKSPAAQGARVQIGPEPSSGGVAYESPNKHLCACALHIYKK
jgi:hypothetical protein